MNTVQFIVIGTRSIWHLGSVIKVEIGHQKFRLPDMMLLNVELLNGHLVLQ